MPNRSVDRHERRSEADNPSSQIYDDLRKENNPSNKLAKQFAVICIIITVILFINT